jgi:Flp pilus assembly pilin Flp
MLLKPQNQKRRGAVLVEYALLIAGVALISAAAVSLFGHKTSDLIATVAAVLPGAHVDDNAPVMSGHLIETGPVGTGGSEALDITAILAGNGTDRLGTNVMGPASPGAGNGVGGLVVESE